MYALVVAHPHFLRMFESKVMKRVLSKNLQMYFVFVVLNQVHVKKYKLCSYKRMLCTNAFTLPFRLVYVVYVQVRRFIGTIHTGRSMPTPKDAKLFQISIQIKRSFACRGAS